MRLNWAERLVRRISAQPVLVFTMFFSSVLTAVLALAGFGLLSYRWIDETYLWRDDEYEKLTALRAGFALSWFEDQLGAPLFRRPVAEMAPKQYARTPRRSGLLPYTPRLKVAGLEESSFQGRGSWVQAISDETETVLVYAVTACDAEFVPTFEAPDGALRATLNRSTFESVVRTEIGFDTISQFSLRALLRTASSST